MTEPLDAGHGSVPLDLLEIYEAQEFRAHLSGRRLATPSTANMFIPRSSWGARSPENPPSTDIDPNQLACHYEGPKMGTFSHDRCPSKIRGIQTYHMDKNGWNDIAYSHLACPHGYVFEGRGVGHRTAANGTKDANDHAYAVCFLGGVGDAFTSEAQHAFWLAARHLKIETRPWRPHKFYVATACPGDSIEDWLEAGHPDPFHAPEPVPLPAPIEYPEDNMKAIEAHTGALDAEGNGYLDEVYAPDGSKVFSVVFNVQNPPESGYKVKPPDWGRLQIAGATRIVLYDGTPGIDFGCTIWVAED